MWYIVKGSINARPARTRVWARDAGEARKMAFEEGFTGVISAEKDH